MSRIRSLLPSLLLCSVLTPCCSLSADEAVGAKVYRSAVFGAVVVMREKGSGSGWLVDRERRLVLTNYHVVSESRTVKVIFPRFKSGRPVAETQAYRKGPFLSAKVIRTDRQRDLALLQLESLPAQARELKLAEEEPAPGERVHSIGSPGRSDALWLYTAGAVRSVYDKKWVVEQHDSKKPLKLASRIIETQTPVNPGDSGGPLLNDQGEVVGVVQGRAKDANLITYAIAVSEVRAFLRSVRDRRAARK